jgi:thioredoxin 2
MPNGKAPICGKCKSVLAIQDGITSLSDSTFSNLIQKSPLPVIVDFWAPWCQPCLAFASTVKNVAMDLAGRYVMTKLDTQANPQSGQRLNVRGIPTVILFKNGAEKDRQSGAISRDMFLNWISRN